MVPKSEAIDQIGMRYFIKSHKHVRLTAIFAYLTMDWLEEDITSDKLTKTLSTKQTFQ